MPNKNRDIFVGHPVYRLHNFQSQNFVKLSFTSIQCLCWSFVICEYVFGSNSSDIVALCETKLDDWNESSKFSVRAYLPLIWKNSATHINGFVFYMKEGLPFSGDLLLETGWILNSVFNWPCLTWCLISFSSIYTVFVLGFQCCFI